jgi:hypothetical protein
MSVRRRRRRDPETGETRECWMVDVVYEQTDGRRERIRKVSPVQTRRGAEEYERQLRNDLLMGRYGSRKEVPTFDEWWHGRYWNEWVIGRKNKPGSVEAKRSTYRHHLLAVFGAMRLDEIKVGEVARFRAGLITKGLTDKTVNNILAVLSKALRYAADVEIIPRAPRSGCSRWSGRRSSGGSSPSTGGSSMRP